MVCLALAMGLMAGAQDVALHVLVELAAALLQFDQLGLRLESIEQDDAAVVGQTQAGCDVRRPGFVGLAFGFEFFVERHRFRSRFAGGPILFVFVSGGPVHHGVRHFLPLVALGAQVADALALDFPLGGKLVGAVFQDEALGEVLRRSRPGGQQEQRRSGQQGDQETMKVPHDRKSIPNGLDATCRCPVYSAKTFQSGSFQKSETRPRVANAARPSAAVLGRH